MDAPQTVDATGNPPAQPLPPAPPMPPIPDPVPKAADTVARDLLAAFDAFEARVAEMAISRAAVAEAASLVAKAKADYADVTGFIEKKFEAVKEFL